MSCCVNAPQLHFVSFMVWHVYTDPRPAGSAERKTDRALGAQRVYFGLEFQMSRGEAVMGLCGLKVRGRRLGYKRTESRRLGYKRAERVTKINK